MIKVTGIPLRVRLHKLWHFWKESSTWQCAGRYVAFRCACGKAMDEAIEWDRMMKGQS